MYDSNIRVIAICFISNLDAALHTKIQLSIWNHKVELDPHPIIRISRPTKSVIEFILKMIVEYDIEDLDLGR